jgi:hypothetical protein
VAWEAPPVAVAELEMAASLDWTTEGQPSRMAGRDRSTPGSGHRRTVVRRRRGCVLVGLFAPKAGVYAARHPAILAR